MGASKLKETNIGGADTLKQKYEISLRKGIFTRGRVRRSCEGLSLQIGSIFFNAPISAIYGGGK